MQIIKYMQVMYFLISDCSRCEVPHTVNKTELRQFVVGEQEISELFKAKKNKKQTNINI